RQPDHHRHARRHQRHRRPVPHPHLPDDPRRRREHPRHHRRRDLLDRLLPGVRVTSIKLSVYTPDGATLIAHLPPMTDPHFQVALNDLEPGGSFQIPLTDHLLTDHPTLLDGDNVIKA